MNVQPQGIPMGEQFFQQPNDPHLNMGMAPPRMFSPQMDQIRMVNRQQQQQQQQQPGIPPNLQGLVNARDPNGAYLLNQKLGLMIPQQQNQPQNQTQVQNQTQNPNMAFSQAQAQPDAQNQIRTPQQQQQMERTQQLQGGQGQGQMPSQNQNQNQRQNINLTQNPNQNQNKTLGQSKMQLQGQPQGQMFNMGTPVMANIPPGLSIFQQPGAAAAPMTARPLQRSQMMNPPLDGLAGIGPQFVLPPPNHLFVRDVWRGNLYSEFASIRRLIKRYNYVAISIEFVGTLARPIGTFRSKEDYHFQTMRSNVDILNPVQLGLSLSDINGNKTDNEPSTWQFNFEFDASKETISGEALELLSKCGINVESHRTNGVDKLEFARLIMDSGLVMDENVTWITFHAAYDLGFLVKMLSNDIMPTNREEFGWWVQKFLPSTYDLNLLYKIIRSYKPPHMMQQQQQQQQQQHQLQLQLQLQSQPQPQQAQQPQQQPPMPPQGQQHYTLTTLSDELGIPRFPVFTATGGQSLLMLLCFCQLSKLSMEKLPDGSSFQRYKNVIYGINEENAQ